MINYMKEGEFVKANDVYLLTAIGNAPWPIGLTMVGIHERSGRENGNEGQQSKVMFANSGVCCRSYIGRYQQGQACNKKAVDILSEITHGYALLGFRVVLLVKAYSFFLLAAPRSGVALWVDLDATVALQYLTRRWARCKCLG